MLGVRSTMLNEAVVRTVRAAGLVISAWACNDEATIARILALGVDSMTTDRPDPALRSCAPGRRIEFGRLPVGTHLTFPVR